MSGLVYERVTTLEGLWALVRRLRGPVAFDFETTSLDPSSGSVRLASLCNDDVQAVVDFFPIRGGFASAAKLFAKRGVQLVVFNATFEAKWFKHAGVEPDIRDVQNLRKAFLGGGRYSLADMARWDLEEEVDKGEQASNWSAPELLDDQWDYAFGDASVTWRLWRKWSSETDDDHKACAALLDALTLPVIAMEQAGMRLDQTHHEELVTRWSKRKLQLETSIRRFVSVSEVGNIGSNSQWSDYFSRVLPDSYIRAWPRTESTGQLQMTNSVLEKVAAAAHGTPLQELIDELISYHTISKYTSSFGETLLTRARLSGDGRVHGSFNIGAARTLRFSSSSPNLQQVPRNKDVDAVYTSVRDSFVAALGTRVVSLDYSGIELRVLALLSGDKQLLEDVVYGDVHSEVASVIAGGPIDKTTRDGKAARQAAKSVSFGIIYGAGAGGISASTRKPLTVAQSYIDFWSDRYPDAFGFRHDRMEEARQSGFLRMADGGTIYLSRRPELPKCANYPVQRAAWTIMARAVCRHHETMKADRWNRCRMLATIHDQMIDEAPTRLARPLLKALNTDMTLAYLDVFPGAPTDNLLEGGVGPSWGSVS